MSEQALPSIRVGATAPTSPVPDASREALLRERRRRITRDRLERVIQIFSPVLLLLIWEAVSAFQLIDQRFFPRPSLVLQNLVQMVASGELWRHLSASLLRVAVGVTIGTFAGVTVGLVMGASRWVRAILNPWIASIYPIPKIAIFPLILLVFGLTETSKYVTVALAVFFLVLIPTMAGVMGIPRIYVDAARNFGARGLDFYLRVALPGALPAIFTSIRLAMGVALIVIVSVEFVGADAGIGYLIWNSWQLFNVNRMFVGLMVAAAVGYLSTLALEELQKRFVPWRL